MALQLDFTEDGGVQFSGTLIEMPFGKLLLWILKEKQQGELSLSLSDHKIWMFFSQGYPVGLRGGTPENFLGWILMERGYIQEAAYVESLQRMTTQKTLQGQVLLQMKAIDEAQLGEALRIQLFRKIIAIFGHADGRFVFRSRPQLSVFDVHAGFLLPYQLISQGLRQHNKSLVVSATLQTLEGQAIRLSHEARSPAFVESLSLDIDEQSALQLLWDWTSRQTFESSDYIDANHAQTLLAILATSEALETGPPSLIQSARRTVLPTPSLATPPAPATAPTRPTGSAPPIAVAAPTRPTGSAPPVATAAPTRPTGSAPPVAGGAALRPASSPLSGNPAPSPFIRPSSIPTASTPASPSGVVAAVSSPVSPSTLGSTKPAIPPSPLTAAQTSVAPAATAAPKVASSNPSKGAAEPNAAKPAPSSSAAAPKPPSPPAPSAAAKPQAPQSAASSAAAKPQAPQSAASSAAATTKKTRVKREPRPGVLPPANAAKELPLIPAERLAPEERDLKEIIENKLLDWAEGIDHYELLEIDKKTPAAEMRKSYYRLSRIFHPDRVAGTSLDPYRKELDKFFAHLNQAYQTLSSKESRTEYDQQLLDPSLSNSQDRAARAAQAELFLVKAKVFLKKKDFASAEKELHWALELLPDEGEFLAHQAWIQFNHPKNANKREKLFDATMEALDQAYKKNCDGEVYLTYKGLLFKEQGKLKEAQIAFDELLRKNPRNPEAQQEARWIKYAIENQQTKSDKDSKDKKSLWDRLKK